MPNQPKRGFRFSLSTNIVIGLCLGILAGLFLGEYCAPLQLIGNAFIKLLQMSILPYLVASIIAGIGSLTYAQAKSLARKAGVLLLLFWAIGFCIILVLPLAFPNIESGSFFSTSLVAPQQKIDFIDLYIPANPFESLAENVVPAVVLFSMFVGVALIGATKKDVITQPLSILSEVLMKVTKYIVYLTPIGVFAISASAAGTMTVAVPRQRSTRRHHSPASNLGMRTEVAPNKYAHSSKVHAVLECNAVVTMKTESVLKRCSALIR